MYLLGYDIGSSSIKAALVDISTGKTLQVVHSPSNEMEMLAKASGWAEQDPELWWTHVCLATQQILRLYPDAAQQIKGIGIAYQMHGLVVVDENQEVLRPAIIWCDSRAVDIGRTAFTALGEKRCLEHLLNSPGNFTASKLKWVQENEPAIYTRIHKAMLPGDYIAMRLTGAISTTISGLSEGMLWDFKNNTLAGLVLDHYGIAADLIPTIVPTCSIQGTLNTQGAAETGLHPGIPVAYRAGDQPNNALSLNVLKPGEVAATGGTSGVVYGLVDRAVYDMESRVNGFAHVNYQPQAPRIGILLCINGAGSQYSWIKQQIAKSGLSYEEMEQQMATLPIGADGLRVLPFGNGAERMLGDRNLGACINNLQFNQHTRTHLYRAALEGIAFSFVYGIDLLKNLGLQLNGLRVGNDNLFQSAIFAHTIATLLGNQIEVVETTGAVGAAKAAGVATRHYAHLEEAMQNVQVLYQYEPQTLRAPYEAAYALWREDLNKRLEE
ncbi:MAG: FGGY family carbohydrate kinase [Bacteroidota bacterium]